MVKSSANALGTLVLTAVLVAAGCHRAGTSGKFAGFDAEAGPFEVTGPYAHENLSVFLIHSPNQDDREFITLDQGLKEGWVKVSEKQHEEVGELQIENQSEYPLFLQEGDRLQGGKQDRIIIASLVVPPKSGQMPVPAFCIEPGRWQAASGGLAFVSTANAALAPKSTRQAAKFERSQQKVWDSVYRQRESTVEIVAGKMTTSSLNEALDSPQVQKISEEFAKALEGVLEDHPDSIGVAIVINDNIEEVNVYPNHSLLQKLYPRLLQSYGLQATLEKDKTKEGKAVAASDIAKFMAEEKGKTRRKQAINADNSASMVVDFDGDASTTYYKGEAVHRQMLSKMSSSGKK
jgi:hypothetical protein